MASSGGDGRASRRYVTDDGKPVVQIAFYEPKGAQNGQCAWMNSLAACWTSDGINRFAHCEIRFSNGRCCSVTDTATDAETGKEYGGYVHYTKRSLRRDGYIFVEFAVNSKQEAAMIKCAREAKELKIPFNQAGMRLNFVAPFKWMPLDRGGTSYFCSELVTALLHKAGMLTHLRPCTVSPNSLFSELKTLESVCDGFNWGHKGQDFDHTQMKRPIRMKSSKKSTEKGVTFAPRKRE
jgi:hypothetical protein